MVSIGSIHGGVRGNIIPDSVELVGTIRTLDPGMRTEVHERVRNTAEQIAKAGGAEARVMIDLGYPVTVNDPELTEAMLPTLQWAAGRDRVALKPPVLGAEDFSYFAQECPGFYIGLGVTPEASDWTKAPANHSPLFFADEAALPVGVRVMAGLAVDYLMMHAGVTDR